MRQRIKEKPKSYTISKANKRKVAILKRAIGIKSLVTEEFKKQKPSFIQQWSSRIQRALRSQNAFGKFKKILRKSVTALRQTFYEIYSKEFFKSTAQSFRKLKMASKQQIGISSNVKDASDVQKPSVILVALNLFHRFLSLCVRFVLVKVHGEHGPSMEPIDDLLLLESATSIAEKIRTNKVNIRLNCVKLFEFYYWLKRNFSYFMLQLTSTQVLKSFIARIKQVNPLLNCVVDERFDDALQDAAKVDELIASNKYTAEQLKEMKPFLGVPISTKDCIAVKDMLHTGGLWLRRNIRSEEDSDAIRLMRDAGAIPFAITNVSEVCMW